MACGQGEGGEPSWDRPVNVSIAHHQACLSSQNR
jgi:hypothetical protein